MAESLLSITFEDTVSSSDPAIMSVAINNIRDQMIAAAERIQRDPEAIYAYITIRSSLKKPEVLPVPVISKENGISAAKAILNQVVTNQQTITATSQPKHPAPALVETIPALDEERMLDIVFKNLKRTQKSLSIVRYLVQNSGNELTVDELSAGASVPKNDLSSWLAVTGNKIPAITRPSRGIYKFNPDNLNITNNNGEETNQ